MSSAPARRGRERLTLGLVATLLFTCAQGCSDSSSTSSPQAQRGSQSTPLKSSAPTAAKVQVDTIEKLQVRAPHVADLTLTAAGIAFVTASRGGSQEVVWVDRRTRRERILFRTRVGGQIQGIAAQGQDVAWTYVLDPQEDPAAPVRWRLYNRNLGAGQATMMEQPAGPNALPPVPILDRGRLAYVFYKGVQVRRSDIYIVNLRSGKKTRIAQNAPTDQIALSGGHLVYNASTQVRDTTGHVQYQSDLRLIELASTVDRTLTHRGDTSLPVMHGDWVVWQETHGRVVAMRLPSARVFEVGDGEQGFLRVGDSFVAYLRTVSRATGIEIASLGREAVPVLMNAVPKDALCVPCGLAATGQQLAWGESGRGSITVTIDKVAVE